MASKVVSDAVDAFLADNWTICPIYVENSESETPSDGSPFLLVQYFASDTVRLTVDDKVYLEDGRFRIVIHVEAGQGVAKLRQWGALLIDLFRDVTFDDVKCGVAEDPFTLGSPDGNYLVSALVVPFRYRHDPH